MATPAWVVRLAISGVNSLRVNNAQRGLNAHVVASSNTLFQGSSLDGLLECLLALSLAHYADNGSRAKEVACKSVVVERALLRVGFSI